jgi:hypothetical protein
MKCLSFDGTLFENQVAPELVERKRLLAPGKHTAASLVPSAEQATEYQLAAGTLFVAQEIPESGEV